MPRQPVGGKLLQQLLEHFLHLPRMGHADRIAEGNLIYTHFKQAFTHLGYLSDGNFPFIGASEHRRHISADPLSPRTSKPDGLLQYRKRLIDALVDVFSVMGFAGRHEYRILVNRSVQGPLQSLPVGNQRPISDSFHPGKPSGQLLSVGQLGNPTGVDKRSRFDIPHAGGDQPLGDFPLHFRRQYGRFVLQSIAESHFDDSDLRHTHPPLPQEKFRPLL